MNKIKLYDTTLRDGAQSSGVSFSLEDKLKIAKKLSDMGIHYIEGGWPGSNPKDINFFKEVKKLDLNTIDLESILNESIDYDRLLSSLYVGFEKYFNIKMDRISQEEIFNTENII